MPREENKALKVVVPVVALLGAIGVAVAVFLNTGTPPPPATTPPSATTPAPSTPAPAGASPAAQAGPAAAASPAPATPPAPAVAVTPAAVVGEPVPPGPIGSLDPAGDLMHKVEFSARGAGVERVLLTRHFETIRRDTHLEIQGAIQAIRPDTQVQVPVVPMAALGVLVNGEYADLFAPGVWREVAPGAFEAVIRDTSSGADLLRLSRRYEVAPGSYTIRLHQSAANLSPHPLTVRWYQMGVVDLAMDRVAYTGDKRRLRFGYLMDPQTDPGRQYVLGKDYLLDHTELAKRTDPLGRVVAEEVQWPNERSVSRQYSLSWVGMTNRYFAAAMGPLLPADGSPVARAFDLAESVDRLGFVTPGQVHLAMRINSRAIPLAPGATADLSMVLYAGPQSKHEIRKDPLARAAGIQEIVVYNFGGCCGGCTFQWLTAPILGTLRFLHDHVVFDWSIAIVVLVLIVRTILHPVTKWSQIRMQRFGKQMQALAPKMQKLKEKYGSDSKTLQAETAKLWREEGVNPAGMLGCFPIFLQTPIWIAVSATIMFAAELRHEGALFGVFQMLGTTERPFWFMGDLGEPDRLIYFGKTVVTIPMMGELSSFNILPFVLMLVFWAQQKYLTPPQTSATMTPEQEMQMKMVKWMTVFLFPVMMYNAPSGMSLYFIANSTLGIMESRWIRRHIETHDLLNLDRLKERRAAKGGGFFSRLQEAAEKHRQLQEQRQRPPGKKKP
ncbi:MAG: YidC/Oxa1 family insertase periplasmic-domain containing protein [Phycisphaeraceae bacterium]|nr:MAG: YidC/Oxa1 family insertase periplasmic-domain containing protein [Phycisphaeraceae bacterium]